MSTLYFHSENLDTSQSQMPTKRGYGLYVQADVGNSGLVFLGDSSGQSISLSAGASLQFSGYFNLSEIYARAAVMNDVLHFMILNSSPLASGS